MVNYFELYGIQPSFTPNTAAVKSKYYELSRLYHPDRFTMAGEHERAEALRMAALNNDAYKTLNNADTTMSYILRLNELLEEEEKYSLPPAFLMEMMDLNETVSEYEMEPDNESMKTQALNALDEQVKQWAEDTTPLTDMYNAGNHSTELLLKIKDYYFRKKYLLRIQQRINTFASR
jgi:molecular chaperone HscB